METVYGIFRGSKIVYIGKTNNFKRRVKEHKRNIRDRNGPKRFKRYIKKSDRIFFKILY
jgi:predicted GIY-YIG superfamily endonuclease